MALRVARMNLWIDPVFDQLIQAQSSMHLEVIEKEASTVQVWSSLERAHVYQITAAKDEIAKAYQVNNDNVAAFKELLLVSSSGAGYDTVDVPSCTKRGIAVVSQLGGNAPAVGEMAIGLMLAVSRRIVESDRLLRTTRGFTRESLMGQDLNGKTLGLVGLGYTGTRVAHLAKAFGMRVLAYDPLITPTQFMERGAQACQLDELLAQSDFVSLHCPRDASTMGMLNAERFAAMKTGSIFISTSRGGIHDERALYAALASGHLRGAGLDVWAAEPPSLDAPLLSLPNVVATFHTAGVSVEARRNVARMAAEHIIQIARGERPARLINPEVWEHFQRRWTSVFG